MKKKPLKEVVLPTRGPRMSILRVRKDDREALLFLSTKIELYEVHGSSTGTLVCTLEKKTCDGCQHKQAKKVYGAAHVYDPFRKQHFVLPITKEGVYNLRDTLDGRESPRGLYALVTRYQNRGNMPLIFAVKDWWEEEKLPGKAKPCRASLERIWQWQEAELVSATVAE